MNSIADDFSVPDGYELQVLDPIDGRIAKPKGWYYSKTETPTGWVWTLSKERGEYDTGLKIQLFHGFESEKYSKTNKEFIEGFINHIITTSNEVRSCGVHDYGDFVRHCVEVFETFTTSKGTKDYRIQYTGVWYKKIKIGVTTTFGTRPDLWGQYKDEMEVMSYKTINEKDIEKNL